ncbi:hypothetical protein NMG60_11028870 [Bertholletia excelsa]
MKIFNWVHRKFHHKDGLGRNVKKSETETQVLLGQVSPVDMLDGWRDGIILTIGTFGLDPLREFDLKNQCLLHKEGEKEDGDAEEYPVETEVEYDNDDYMDDTDEEEEEELNPLVFTAADYIVDENVLKADLVVAGNGSGHLSVTNSEIGLDCSKKMMKKERTTLADLFIADGGALGGKRDSGKKIEGDFNKKTKLVLDKKKKGISLAKKLMPRAAENARPMKKLQQLMTRMMKRKIHPDMEMDSEATPTAGGVLAGKYEANESISLLPPEVEIA